jgi:hypothetical protein
VRFRSRPLRLLAAAVTFVGAPFGCRDGTGPDAAITVTITASETNPPVVSVGADSQPIIACTVELLATATGTGTATWLDATLKFYLGRDRTRPVDSAVFAAGDIQGAWGSAGIDSGATQVTGLQVQAGIPFAITMDFRYRSGGRVRTAPVSYTCGESVPPNATPPAILTASVTNAPDSIEPGDTLGIQFTVNSPMALWETAVDLSGPCQLHQTVVEYPQHNVSDTAFLALPATCALGVPMTVTVHVVDAALQQSSRSLPTLSLVDVTPPRVGALYARPTGGSYMDVAGGDYFGGDSIDLLLYGTDNHSLQTAIWEIAPTGARDSFVVNAADFSRQVRIPVPSGFTGSIELRLYAHDAVGLTSDTVRTLPDSLRVYPTVDRPTNSARIDGEIRDLAIDLPRGVIYLLQTNQQRIAVLNIATLTVTKTLPLPPPLAFDLSPGGDSLVVVLVQPGALGIIDLRQPVLSATILPLQLDTTLAQRPTGLRIATNGKAFVSFEGNTAAANTLLEVDLTTGTQRFRADAGDGGLVGAGAIGESFDRTVLVSNGGPGMFRRYTAATDAFGPAGSAIPYGVTPVLDSTGQTVAVGLDIYDANLQFLRRVRSRSFGNGVPTALSPDGAYLYHTYFRDLVRSRVSDGAIVDRSVNPILSTLVRLSPDGALVVTAESNCCTASPISIIRLQ